jgi:alpha-tubulin suppressor-like RCC1 family protein
MIPGVSGGLLNFSMAARRTCVIVLGDAGVSGGPVICWGPGPPAAVAGITAANGLAVTDDHVCVTTAIGGNVLCWGDNTYGQLGDGTTTSSDVAVPVGGLTEVMIKAGPQFSCASNLAGTTWCWGQNMGGQLGNGTTSSSGQPVKVLPDPAGIVFITGQHVYANVGAVSCWGTGACGDGGGPSSVRLTPTRVALGGPALTEPAGSDATSCTVLVGGSVECWGANDHGQLGDGTVVDHLTPGAVLLPSGEQAKYISATADGSSFYALMTDSSVYAWGRNDRGQLGDGTTTDRSTPVRVVGVATPYGVTAGTAHACSQTSSFAVQCWGANDLGQLGDGTFVDRPTPVTISF